MSHAPGSVRASARPPRGDAPSRPHAGPADPADPADRGDVPGWVLITLMTAGLVIILWGVAGPLLQNVFTQAINRVASF